MKNVALFTHWGKA